MDVEMIDAMTVSGTCDKDALTVCVNDWMLGNTDEATATTCGQTAGCTMAWEDMTPEEQQTMATKFDTRVATLAEAYDTMFDTFEDDMETATAAHKTRQDVIDADFAAALLVVATDMGCDATKLSACAMNDFRYNCLERCDCGENVITITPTRVNTFSVLKSTYGDLTQMSRTDINTVNEMILKF